MKTIKDSDILRLARRMIKDKRTYRVCYAIADASHQLNANERADSLVDWVAKMLEGYCFFEDWLIKFHPEFAKQKKITSTDHSQKLRPGRISWLDWMIAECEKAESQVSAN